ncbi:MAG: hypothetical protein FJ388_25485, partial [Verrucomicrobia bacterium]|nr:hypothetical protein [Verrucomicrobiota bacterium]
MKFGASLGFGAWGLELFRPICLALACLILFAAPLASYGIERFPPPEFESGYKMPPTTTPPARAEWLGWLDVAVLAGALGLASYLALKKRSRD